jgi:NAD(P)-dependent dehydrogenase (short-subunit alcohol dehydrogenase family)
VNTCEAKPAGRLDGQVQVSGVAREISLTRGSALAVRCDVLHRAEVEDMVARVETAIGRVDLLVNNAGQRGPVIPGLVRTAMSESALSCGEPNIEQMRGDEILWRR